MIQSIERFTLSKLRGFGEAGELLTAHRLDCSLVEKWRFSDVLSFGCFRQLWHGRSHICRGQRRVDEGMVERQLRTFELKMHERNVRNAILCSRKVFIMARMEESVAGE
jgi:hypothetical protein